MAFTLKNINALQLMATKDQPNTGVCITPISGGMSVGGNVDITGGLSVSTMKLGTGSITDTSGTISYGSTNFLASTGNITTTGGSLVAGSTTITGGIITDTSNLIDFAGTSISSTGGASISGGVTLNGYTYPPAMAIGTSQFLYYKDASSGISGIGLTAGSGIAITYGESDITITNSGGGGGGTPAGSTTQIQYNDGGGSFGADSSFTWTEGTSTLGVSGNINVTDGDFILNTSSGASAFQISTDQNDLRGQITFYHQGGSGTSVTIQPSDVSTTSYTLTLPTTSGTNGQFLQTDGTGTLSFATQTGASDISGLNDGFTNTSNNLVLGPVSSSLIITTGSDNTGVGEGVFSSLTDANNNTVFGSGAGANLTTATTDDNNTAIGFGALAAASGACSNVAVGYNAGGGLTTGDFNVFVGMNAGSGTCNNGVSNSVVIGYNAQGTGASNEITLGNPNITSLRCADTTIASLSDARDKNDIRDSTYGLNFLENVRPVEFTWDRRVLTPDDENDPKQGKRRVGFIAQELLEASGEDGNQILDLVYTANPQRLEAKYGNLIPVMVKAIQDLKAEVDTIKEHLNLE